jgi:hypothetical protein
MGIDMPGQIMHGNRIVNAKLLIALLVGLKNGEHRIKPGTILVNISDLSPVRIVGMCTSLLLVNTI